jgi:hypothetical protein
MDDNSSIRNVDGPSFLKIELHVPRRELERKFEIVLLAESARTEMRSSANESERADLPLPVSLTPSRAMLQERQCVDDSCMFPAGNWSEHFR